MKTIYILLILVISSAFLNAQIKDLPKFGKISMEEMETDVCPIDSTAHAFYLFDKGSTSFVYRQTVIRSNEAGSGKGFQLVFKRHLRLKILDKSASDYGDFEIALYNQGGDQEKATNIKGFTYNLEGKNITKTKFDTKQIIYEKKSDNITIVKIALPEIREGSVIELEFEILSDFLFNLQEWYFQKPLPVLYSEYRVAIPKFFYYKPSIYGYHHISNESTRNAQTIRLTYVDQSNGAYASGTRYNHEEKYHDNINTYYAKNIPAFKAESYLRTQKNYLTRVAFELEGTQLPNSRYVGYSSSWKDVAQQLLKNERFGGALGRDAFLEEASQLINSSASDISEKTALAFKLIQKKMQWNGQERLFAETSLNKTWEEGTGNSADINLCLVALLKRMGLPAYPVVLSTQSNGILPLTHASISDLNYVIAMTEIDNNIVLMDASDKHSLINLLPERCLNGKGHVIDANRFDEINIQPSQGATTRIRAMLKMNEGGEFEGQAEINEGGYAAKERRQQYHKQSDSLLFARQLEKEFPGLNIKSLSLKNLEDNEQNLIDSMEVQISEHCDLMADMLVFSPLAAFKTQENPFKLENRDYPIEFSYPIHQSILCSIEIPDGYEIESLPAPIRAAMPNKDIEMTFVISANGNNIQVMSDFKVNKLLFLPEEYQAVKETFAYLINKHNEKVVLKKM